MKVLIANISHVTACESATHFMKRTVYYQLYIVQLLKQKVLPLPEVDLLVNSMRMKNKVTQILKMHVLLSF